MISCFMTGVQIQLEDAYVLNRREARDLLDAMKDRVEVWPVMGEKNAEHSPAVLKLGWSNLNLQTGWRIFGMLQSSGGLGYLFTPFLPVALALLAQTATNSIAT